MYINFLQNQVSRSVKSVHTIVFLQKFVSCINFEPPNNNSEKIDYLRHTCTSSLNVHV